MINYQLSYDTIQQYVEKYMLTPTGLDAPTAKKLSVQLGVSTVIVYYFYKLILYRLYFHPANQIPGPKVSWIPFMGNFFEVVKEGAGIPHKRWTKQYGGIVTYHGEWNRPRIVVTDPLLLKQVLTTNEYDYVKPPRTSEFLRRVLGNGVLLAEGETHRHQRKMLNPAFSVNAIRSILPLMAMPGHRLRDHWLAAIQSDENKKGNKECTEMEISTGLSFAALDVIGWAFGQDFKSLEFAGTPNQSKLSQAYLQLFSNDGSLVRLLTFLFPKFIYVPISRNRLVMKDLKVLDKESEALVQVGIERAKKAKGSGAVSDKPKDLLDTMVDLIDEETGQGFTADELKNQCLTFLAAGHETTSVSLSWALWLLAKDQTIQDELRSEVLALFKGDDVPSYDAINALPLLNNVIRETLRLIPSVPMVSRVARVTTTLGSYVLPMGTQIDISIMALHHSTEIWGSDAEEFKPKRWDSSEKIGNAYQYMPFLAGGRQCIGYKFALVEFKMLLAILVRDIQYFERPDFKISKKQEVTLKPFPNMTLWLKPVVN
ncbi:hypothetical protein INT47_001201 [Mucor saturninus]|uniref:Cytochrome P450 n=1 Tax=Mucor saturninus TaxID=64648 RepID=A0A8H7RMT8_9FUNG|nr:hypothetical protein INT47_001201 [Mucor saturninus]